MTKPDERLTWRYWAREIVHHAVVHPMLPIADALDLFGLPKLAQVIYNAHGLTAPPKDVE